MRSIKKTIKLLLCTLVLFTGIFAFSQVFLNQVNAATGINRTINFQGKVVNKTSETNISNGNYSFTFRFYDSASGGTQLPSGAGWSETKTLTVTNGIFRTALGDTTAIPSALDFNADNIYLEMVFNGETFTSRIRMTSVPYAFNAEKVAGLTVTNTTGTLTIPNAKTISFSDAFSTVNAGTVTLTNNGTGFSLLAGTTTPKTLTVSGSTTLADNVITFGGTQTLTLAATKNVSFADAFSTSGAFPITLTGTASTNVTLPTTGTLATLAGSEVFTNKTLTDSTTLFQDEGDNTKKLALQLSGITTGTTRTLTIPNADGTICISGQTCATSGTVGYWSRSTTTLSPATANDVLSISSNDTSNAVLALTATGANPNVLSITGNSLTSGKAIAISSSATAFTGTLFDLSLTGSNAANTGSLLALTNSGTANANISLYLKHYATGTGNLALRVDDESGDTTPFVIDGTGNVGIGTTAPTRPLHITSTAPDVSDGAIQLIDGTLSSTTNQQYGLLSKPYIFAGSASTRSYYGVQGGPVTNSANLNSASLIGFGGSPYVYGSATVGTVTGGFFINQADETSTITNSFGVVVDNPTKAGGATITNNTGLKVNAQTSGTSNIGLSIGEATGTNQTNLLIGTTTQPSGTYSIYNSSADQNYFAGNVGIGITNPGKALDVTGEGRFSSTLTASNGFTVTTGAVSVTGTSGAIALSGLSASSISTGATALTITSSNFNTTATGINSTAIGATTASTGAFTTLSSTGTTTLGNNSATVAINSSDWDIDATGIMTGIGAITMDGNFSQTGATTFGTGTGAVSLNGATTIAANQNFALASGTGTFTQTYTGTATAATVTANSLTSGNILSLTSTSTAAASNTQKGLNIALSGTNATSAQTTYGAYISNTHAGTTSTNVGLYVTASGGTTANYAAIFNAGNVGIGTTTPGFNLDTQVTGGGFAINAVTTYGEANAGGSFIGRGAAGTQANPTASQANNNLAVFGGRGYGATGFTSTSRGVFGVYAAENWTDTAQGAYLSLETTPTGSTTRQESVRISPGGNVGIGVGNTNPNATLDVSGTGELSGLLTLNGGLTVQTGDTFTFNGDAFTDLTGNSLEIASGALTIDDATTGTTGTTGSNSGIEATSAGLRLLGGCSNNQILKWSTTGPQWNCAADATGISDERLKENIVTVEGDFLERISQVRVVEFDFNCKHEAFDIMHCDTDHQTGVIAQELMKLFPELVIDVNGYYQVRYDALALYNLKAVGELAKKIDTLSFEESNNEFSESTQGLKVDTIESFSGQEVSLKVSENGFVTVRDHNGEVKVQFDGKGNATFDGDVTAQNIEGLEVITAPKVVANEVALDKIQARTGQDVALQLTAEGKFIIKDENGEPAITFDADGNGTFKGTLTADKIKANQIEGLEFLVRGITGTTSITSTTGNENTASDSALLGINTSMDNEASSSSDLNSRDTRDTLDTRGTLAIEGLTIIGSATVSADLRVKGNGLIEGILNVIDTITTKNILVTGVADFFANVIFRGDVEFRGQPTFNNDTAGVVSIPKDKDRAEVKFEKPYAGIPVINVSPLSVTLTDERFAQLKADGICGVDQTIEVCQEKLDKAVLAENNRYIITNRSKKGFVINLSNKAILDLEFAWNAFSIREVASND
jgi:hypothetical protein